MPRASSIETAIAALPSFMAVKAGVQNPEPSSSEVRYLITVAGSAENLAMFLLKDKHHCAVQNTQLWNLVDKQRALLHGLNKDLDRVTKERDTYRVKLKEVQATGSPTSSGASDRATTSQSTYDQPPRSTGVSPDLEPSDHSQLAPQIAAETGTNPSATLVGNSSSSRPDLDPPRPTLSPSVPTMGNLQNGASQSLQLENKPALSARRAVPKPLNLKVEKPQIQEPATEERNQTPEDDEEREDARGRRRTRAEDDRDRSVAAIKEQEARSRSKKSKSKSQRPVEHKQTDNPIAQTQSFNATNNGQSITQSSLLVPTLSLPNGGEQQASNNMMAPLRSPGLPMSPRPGDRPIGMAMPGLKQNQTMMNSLPMTPRAMTSAFPLSPRAPKQPLPAPLFSPGQNGLMVHPDHMLPQVPKPHTVAGNDRSQAQDNVLRTTDPPRVNRGLVSSTYPDLLLPPNALPLIQLKVTLATSKPRQISPNNTPSDPSSTFQLSVYSRSSSSELWRVEKDAPALFALDQDLQARLQPCPNPPDRRLFVGSTPVVLTARREAIDSYLDELLDTPMDENSGQIICQFLSADVMQPSEKRPSLGSPKTSHTTSPKLESPGRVVKHGILTKKGKNFGGWKSRFFVLDSFDFRYFEAPGGAHLGTIRLINAQIGKQGPNDSYGSTEDSNDGNYKHAFSILEPKKKDSNSYIRHVLCAESDQERDEWVGALLQYVEEAPSPSQNYASTGRNGNNQPAGALGGLATGWSRSESSSPERNLSSPLDSSSPEVGATRGANISGPTNGAVIVDGANWGNRAPYHTSGRDMVRNILHFKKPSADIGANGPGTSDMKSPKPSRMIRPVFGMQLSEAVQACGPEGVDTDLPAVVYRCLEYLRGMNASNEEGLFRQSGSSVVVRSLKDRFNIEGDADLLADNEYHDVHAVASLLKQYLRELPTSLLTRDLHIEFLRVLDIEDHSQKVATFNGLVHRLPRANLAVLNAISKYLLEVVQRASANRMNVKNMAIVFSPSLNIPGPVFTMLLTDYEAIFVREPESSNLRTTELEIPRHSDANDFRSPRHQMFSDLTTPAYNQTTFGRVGPAGLRIGGIAPSNFGSLGGNTSEQFGFAPLQR